MNTRRFLEALARTPEPPCTGCTFYDVCAGNQWACWDFLAYVKEPTTEKMPAMPANPRAPNAEWYAVVHDEYTREKSTKGLKKPRKRAPEVFETPPELGRGSRHRLTNAVA